ncbi:PhoX family phosphatase [Sphingomonas sp. RP10(2022)]|uniref:PhoX family phosphatase n=1 Tax=Sphingomonas liriopis TaxID=2949094 RepID=A0A9X2KPC9_9SPHN|nr:alkaline phosphatase PhoX [Sphingomonas liriopis]MCP3733767.1 PhoX family phosphatase [Sphingomonas liriopis]
MTIQSLSTIGYDDGDIDTNTSGNPHIGDLIASRYSRRQTLRGGLSAMTAAVFGGAMLTACDKDDTRRAATVTAGGAVTTSTGKTVTLNGTVTGAAASATVWTQTSGPIVSLANAATTTASFTAPAVTASTVLGFQFTSTSTDGLRSVADTTVTVTPATLDFTAVPKSLADVVAVPSGYQVTVLYRLGDPINGTVGAFANDGTDTTYSARAGDHHDGMSYFGLAASGNAPDAGNSSRGLLVLNHENITQAYLHPNGATSSGGVRPTAEVLKEMECHGVSVIEITRGTGSWSYVATGSLNRRITPFTPTSFSGPVAGSSLLFTAYSPTGVAGRGTINNCANGTMPWNTYLTNEENWAGYFRRDTGDNARRTAAVGAKSTVAFARYGLSERTGNYGWTTAAAPAAGDTRIAKFNATIDPTKAANGIEDFRNEPNQYGWVVEIDPFDAASVPRKRTALGRMNHEGCVVGRTVPGVRPAFYMGDDAQNEYVYKFVSSATWAAADATATNRLAIGDKYLDTGTLYVAKLDADGSGQWLPLVFGQGPLAASNATYAFASQADVLTHARLAGDALGATRMDRPEWTAVNPVNGEMYLTLTNNASRTVATTDAANPRAYTDPKTTGGATNGNANGHIIRFRETGDSSESLTFTWDIYAFGAGSDLNPANINLSNLDATNDFSSPDGLWFARPSNVAGQGTPLMWIETDDGAYTDVTNCMLLAAIPGSVGDGAARTITNSLGGATASQTTRIGKAPGTTLKRFLVGPKECEITGIDSTPDGRAIFVNIQHPGENGSPASITSNWPQSQATGTGSGRPRSATIVITKTDGGIVGL